MYQTYRLTAYLACICALCGLFAVSPITVDGNGLRLSASVAGESLTAAAPGMAAAKPVEGDRRDLATARIGQRSAAAHIPAENAERSSEREPRGVLAQDFAFNVMTWSIGFGALALVLAGAARARRRMAHVRHIPLSAGRGESRSPLGRDSVTQESVSRESRIPDTDSRPSDDAPAQPLASETRLPAQTMRHVQILQPVPWGIPCHAVIKSYDASLRFTSLELLQFLVDNLQKLIPHVIEHERGLSPGEIAELKAVQSELLAHRELVEAQIDQLEAADAGDDAGGDREGEGEYRPDPVLPLLSVRRRGHLATAWLQSQL